MLLTKTESDDGTQSNGYLSPTNSFDEVEEVTETLNLDSSKVNLENFERLKLIGQGGYGKVIDNL